LADLEDQALKQKGVAIQQVRKTVFVILGTDTGYTFQVAQLLTR
jgi:hypothetical protein